MAELYKTYTDYPNESGFNQIAYPVRDAIIIMNPYFAILFMIMMVLTIASYYTFSQLSGRTRLINSLLASSFVTFVISVFFAMGQLITPYHTMTFIGITAFVYAISHFYRA